MADATAPTRILSSPASIPGAHATAAQCCAKYQVSRTTWWRWSQTPGFPQPMRFGRAVRWHIEAVEAFLTQPRA